MSGAFRVHPAQVPVLDHAFTPTCDEAARAARVVAAFDAALAQGRGAVAVDAPIAARAHEVLRLAWRAGPTGPRD